MIEKAEIEQDNITDDVCSFCLAFKVIYNHISLFSLFLFQFLFFI